VMIPVLVSRKKAGIARADFVTEAYLDFGHVARWVFRCTFGLRRSTVELESASFSVEPRGRNPHVFRVFWGDCGFRDGTEIRGIREKIDKEVGKMGGAGEFRPALSIEGRTNMGRKTSASGRRRTAPSLCEVLHARSAPEMITLCFKRASDVGYRRGDRK
jgi:hypothetical protein